MPSSPAEPARSMETGFGEVKGLVKFLLLVLVFLVLGTVFLWRAWKGEQSFFIEPIHSMKGKLRAHTNSHYKDELYHNSTHYNLDEKIIKLIIENKRLNSQRIKEIEGQLSALKEEFRIEYQQLKDQLRTAEIRLQAQEKKTSKLEQATASKAQPVEQEYVFKGLSDADGYFAYLQHLTGQNPHLSGLVKASKSSPGKGGPEHFVGLVDAVAMDSYTNIKAASWMAVDLLADRRFLLQSYTLRHSASNTWYLRNWDLQGSNNGDAWSTLRAHRHDASLNGPASRAHWEVNATEPYRMFRIIITAENSDGHYSLDNSGMEIYGKLELSALE